MSPSACRVDGGFVLNEGHIRLSALHFVLFTFHPFEQKLFSKMQTELKFPLFASDKDPDHRLVHDWSNILEVNDDYAKRRHEGAAAQMAAVCSDQHAPPRVVGLCTGNGRGRSGLRPGAPFSIHSFHANGSISCLDSTPWQ